MIMITIKAMYILVKGLFAYFRQFLKWIHFHFISLWFPASRVRRRQHLWSDCNLPSNLDYGNVYNLL